MEALKDKQTPITDPLASSLITLFETKAESIFSYSFKSIQIALITIMCTTFFSVGLLVGITLFGVCLLYYFTNSLTALLIGGLVWSLILVTSSIVFSRAILSKDFWTKRLNFS